MRRRYRTHAGNFGNDRAHMAAQYGDDLTGEGFESELRVVCGLCGEDQGPAYERKTTYPEYMKGEPCELMSHWPEDSRDAWKKGYMHNCKYSNYEAAARFLERGRDKNDRPLANNTRLIRRGANEIAVRLHSTDIITMFDTGEIEFNTGGWHTVTTRDRLRHASNFSFFTAPLTNPRDGSRETVWVVRRGSWRDDEQDYPLYIFEDGIRFSADASTDAPGALLYEDIAREQREAWEERKAERRMLFGKLRAYRNRVEKALAEPLPVEYADPIELQPTVRTDVLEGRVRPAFLVWFVGLKLNGDTRQWLNFHENGDGGIYMGECEPLVRKLIADKVYESVKETLI